MFEKCVKNLFYILLYFLQLDLHELSKKQQVGPQKPNEDIAQFKRQLDDQTRKIEEQTRQVEEQRRNVDNKIKQISEREKAIHENDKQLQRRKDQLDQLENSLKKVIFFVFNCGLLVIFVLILLLQSGGNAAAVTEMNKELDNTRQQLKKAQDESQRSGAEMERLLQLVQMSQEEQNAKEKTIMDLQQYVFLLCHPKLECIVIEIDVWENIYYLKLKVQNI